MLHRKSKLICILALMLSVLMLFSACSMSPAEDPEAHDQEEEEYIPDEHGSYTSLEDVYYYLSYYGHLPENFITKKEARNLGWNGGSLEPYAPGMCIGGDHFGNNEGLLPDAAGREYYECDIDTLGADSRGAKRMVWSNDGLYFYTEDHYDSFYQIDG